MQKYPEPPMDSFCIIPWIHLNVNPNGRVLQCCITDNSHELGNLRDASLSEIWNNESMRQLRLDLINGKRPASCRKCYEQEDNGIRSFRNSANLLFARHLPTAKDKMQPDGTIPDMQLRYWDFRFSNLCNMKCRMCGSHLSSAWYSDEVALGLTPQSPTPVVNMRDHSKDDLKVLLDEQLDYVEEIYFAGGESLVMDEHYYILEKLIERGKRDVVIRYNTNLLKIRHRHWDNLELWQNFDTVILMASIDAMGPRAEYIRSGSVWSVIDENIKRLLNDRRIIFHVAPTVQVLNALHLPEFIDYLIGTGMDIGYLHMNNVLTEPSMYHINTFDDDYRQRITSAYDSHLSRLPDETRIKLRPQYDSIISYMYAPDGRSMEEKRILHDNFMQVTRKLDAIRGESFLDTFPELHDHFHRYDGPP